MTDAAAAEDPMIGRLVAGKFRVERVLGHGSVGTVYAATHEALHRPIALKTLHPQFAAQEASRARFAREAQLASQLDHPNIVQVYDHGTEPDGVTYLAMELLNGPELATVVTHDRVWTAERIAHVLGQVLAALAAAHRAGIVHRDLKPENIMLVPREDDAGATIEVVKVTDFGIAKSYGAQAPTAHAITTFGTVNGTPEYMSPEQARGDADLDGRSDLYACGVILYELLCGHLPFSADSPLQVLEKHLREAPVPPSQRRAGISSALEAVAMCALAKDRDARYRDAIAMRTALLDGAREPTAPTVSASEVEAVDSGATDATPSVVISLEAEEPVAEAPAIAPETKAPRPAPSRRTRWLVGGVLATLVLAAIAWAALRWREHGLAATSAPSAVADAGTVVDAASRAPTRAIRRAVAPRTAPVRARTRAHGAN